MERKNVWKTYNNSEKEQLQNLNSDYIEFFVLNAKQKENVLAKQ